MAEPTLLEIGNAVSELRREVEKKSIDPNKVDRINVVLDEYEKKNQQLVAAEEMTKNHALEIKSLKEELEKKGVEAGKMREQVDQLELAFAKQTSKDQSFRDTAEFKAMDDFVRTGAVETKALRTDKASDGGVLVVPEYEGYILKRIVEVDPIRTIARVRPISAKSLVIATRTGIPTATYEGEAAAGSDSQSTYGNETLTAFRQTHTTPITRDMLMDSAFNMETEIMDDAAVAFAYGEGAGFVNGTGFKQPAGFMVDTVVVADNTVKSTSGTAGTFSPEDFFKLQGALKQGYNGTFVLNRRTLALVRGMRAGGYAAGDGPFMWQPSFANGGMATIAGDPYVLSNSMPEVGNDLFPVAYGDFRAGYLIVDRTSIEIIRDEYSLKKNAIVEFTIHRWNTGKVVNPEAIKILKLDAA